VSDPDVRPGKAGAAPHAEETSFIEQRLLPVLGETTLLPLWLVVAGHIIAFVVPTLLLALRDRRFAAQAALLLLVFLSGSAIRAEIRQRGRMGLVSGLVLALWIASVGAAIAADHLGVF
jgi:hypothetical protein